jgi:hypothetical protein
MTEVHDADTARGQTPALSEDLDALVLSIYLLEHGANPKAAGRNGITAMHYAIMNGLGQVSSGISMVKTAQVTPTCSDPTWCSLSRLCWRMERIRTPDWRRRRPIGVQAGLFQNPQS